MSSDPIRAHLADLSRLKIMPQAHVQYLQRLRSEHGFVPKVCYDIGACVLHWTNAASDVWPDAEYVLFDAFEPAAFLYPPRKHHIGVLSDEDGKAVRFYQNDWFPGGNSYYREVGDVFPVDWFIEKTCRTLDAVVEENVFPLPDLIKIDVQGAEIDILAGAQKTLQSAKYIIVELQHTAYNEGAWMADRSVPFIESLGFKCIAPLFSNNEADGDYCFQKV